jgi:hypothetical protein
MRPKAAVFVWASIPSRKFRVVRICREAFGKLQSGRGSLDL